MIARAPRGQRQQRLDWADGKHLVGGIAELVTVTRPHRKLRLEAVADKVGELIAPEPIDWPAWRARRATAAAILPGLSRVQRQRLEKKAAKRPSSRF